MACASQEGHDSRALSPTSPNRGVGPGTEPAPRALGRDCNSRRYPMKGGLAWLIGIPIPIIIILYLVGVF